jgi:hypothetical protein
MHGHNAALILPCTHSTYVRIQFRLAATLTRNTRNQPTHATSQHTQPANQSLAKAGSRGQTRSRCQRSNLDVTHSKRSSRSCTKTSHNTDSCCTGQRKATAPQTRKLAAMAMHANRHIICRRKQMPFGPLSTRLLNQPQKPTNKLFNSPHTSECTRVAGRPAAAAATQVRHPQCPTLLRHKSAQHPGTTHAHGSRIEFLARMHANAVQPRYGGTQTMARWMRQRK